MNGRSWKDPQEHGDGYLSHFNTDEIATVITDTEIFFIITGHLAASWARRPIFNQFIQIKAFLAFETNGGRNPFPATHAAHMNFFGLGHFKPPNSNPDVTCVAE